MKNTNLKTKKFPISYLFNPVIFLSLSAGEKLKKILRGLPLLLITYYLLPITPASAQENGQPLGPIQGIPGAYLPDPEAEGIESAGTMFSRIFSNIITFLSIVGALMFLIYFIIGALNWISAGGKPEKVENAKNTMTNAAIGLIVIVAAYSVIYIISRVLGIPILEPQKYLYKLGPGYEEMYERRTPTFMPPGR